MEVGQIARPEPADSYADPEREGGLNARADRAVDEPCGWREIDLIVVAEHGHVTRGWHARESRGGLLRCVS